VELAMNQYASRFNPAQLAGMSLNSNIYDPEEMVKFWEDHIRMGGTPPNRPTQEYTEAYARVYPNSELTDSSDFNMNTSYNEPYSEFYNEEDIDQENQYVNNMSFPDQDPNSMIESNTELGFNATGLPLDYTDLTNPYYVGSQFAPEMQMAAYGGYVKAQDGEETEEVTLSGLTLSPEDSIFGNTTNDEIEMFTPFSQDSIFGNTMIDDPVLDPFDSYNLPYQYGGDLPLAQKGIEYNGKTYSKRDLRRLSRSNPKLVAEILNNGPVENKNVPDTAELIKQINESRIDEEGSDTRETLVGGTEGWINNYQADTEEAKEYRDLRYQAYKVRRETEGLKVLPPKEYHDLYITFQKQNEWFNKNLTQEERNTPDWDKGTPNAKYRKSLEGSGFEPLTRDQISHVQSGYIGGVAMDKVGSDVFTTYEQTGVMDQSAFEGMAISPEDGVFGNTTNDELENKEIGSLIEGTPCANADELSTKCAEVGGVWTAYNAETKTGCSCSEPIIEEQGDIKIPAQPDKRYWLQDNMALANAMDAKFSLQKYYPLATQFDSVQVDPVFKDPTREIAAIAEQATIAGMAGTTFAGPQRAAAVAAKAQGVAGKQIANAIDQVQSYNVGIANNMNVKNAELEYKTQMLNNNELKQLYDNTMLTEQNYDNALREANAAITNQLIARETNAANTYNLNTIYPNFNIQPDIGGDIDIVNAKDFYADANYVDSQTYLDNYIKTIRALDKQKVPADKWPNYINPNQNRGKSNAERNKAIILQGYNQNVSMNGKEVKKNNLLKKGAELRDWFSPLKGY
jgi:hypothetical protein